MVSYKTIIENPEQINFENHSKLGLKNLINLLLMEKVSIIQLKIFQLLVESTVQLEAN